MDADNIQLFESETLQNNQFVSDSGENFIASDFLKTKTEILKLLKNECDSKLFEHYSSVINEVIEILVNENYVFNKVVLKTAIIYLYHAFTEKSLMQNQYSKPIFNGVEILLSKDLNKIIKNKDYLYLNEIILAENLCFLRNISKKDNKKNITKRIIQIDEIIKNYKDFCSKKLLKLLIEERNKI